MSSTFYNDFKLVIRNCSYDNTYKMAWAKSLVEIAIYNVDENDVIEITLEQIANNYLKYYWNQTIYFNLIQGSNLIKPPKIITTINKLIDSYHNSIGNNNPIKFERVEVELVKNLNKEYKSCIKSIISTLKKDVSYRFLNIDKEVLPLYQYNKGDNSLFILREHLVILKEHHDDLFDLINYRWSLILETFNNSPRINKKVRIIDEQDIKRASLNKYKKMLDYENSNRICFICNKPIEDTEVSIDHVIPWSYMYSDDLWNLVYVHKSCNSSKSNKIPTKEDIEKLKDRNNKLFNIYMDMNINETMFEELKLAIDKDYVDNFWLGCKG